LYCLLLDYGVLEFIGTVIYLCFALMINEWKAEGMLTCGIKKWKWQMYRSKTDSR